MVQRDGLIQLTNDYWEVKFDRTCGPQGKGFDHGWEVASFIATGTYDIDHIAKASSFLRDFGAHKLIVIVVCMFM